MTEIFKAFLLMSCVGTVLAFLLMLLKPVTRKCFSPGWNYYVWLIVLVVMMVPFRFNLPEKTTPAHSIEIAEERQAENSNEIIIKEPPKLQEPVEEAISNDFSSAPVEIKPTEQKSDKRFKVAGEFLQENTPLFAQLWVIGAVLVLVLRIIKYKKFLAQILKESKKISCAEIAEYTKETVEVMKNAKVQSPFVIRWLRPVLILPEVEITPCELKNILVHETTHIKRHDILYKWLVNIVKCVHWFNPCVYLIAKEIEKDCEISCDAQAVKGMSFDEKRSYADTILSLLSDNEQKVALTTSMSGSKRSLKERFEMIKNGKETPKKVMVISAILIIVLLGGMIFVSGILNGELFHEAERRRIPVSESREETVLNTVNENDLNKNPYGKILEKYYKALSEKWDGEKVNEESLSAALYDCALFGYTSDEPLLDVGYALIDINDDGVNELIIGETGEAPMFSKDLIWDMYTIEKSKAVRVLESGGKHLNFLCDDGKGGYIIATEDIYGAACNYSYYGVLSGSKLKNMETVAMDYGRDPENPCFRENGEGLVYIDEDEAIDIVNQYREKYITLDFSPFETLKEKAAPVSEEETEKIIERFYEAEQFWASWIYGQRYVTDRMSNSQNMYYGEVNNDSPIQSKEELKAAFETYFTKKLTKEFVSFLNPADIDGKLYIAYGDVGDNGESVEGVNVSRINDEKYLITLDMYSWFDEKSFTRQVYYIFEDGKWVFENDEADKYFFHWQKHENIEYLPVLKKYYLALLEEEWSEEKIDEYGLVDGMLGFKEPFKSIGYCFMDVNGDGVNELLIGKLNAGDKIVRDMYSVKNGEAYRVLVSGDKNRHYICESDEGYIIANEIHTNAMNYSYSYYIDLNENVLKERLWLDWGEWYHSADYLNQASMVVDEERVNEIVENYRAKYITPQFISFETLG